MRNSVHQTLNSTELSPSTRKKTLRLLYRTCGHHAIIPSTLTVLVDYDRTDDALYRGGYADVWKGEYRGREVAVKVIRLYSRDVLKNVINVCHRCYLVSPHPMLTTLCAEILQGGRNVDIPSTSKRPTTDRSDDVADSVRNGIALDGKRKHQRVHQEKSRSRPTRACRSLVLDSASFGLVTVGNSLAGGRR